MVRTAEPQRRSFSPVRERSLSHAARSKLGSSGEVSIRAGNSSRTSSRGLSAAASAKLSIASSQSANGRAARSRAPSPRSGSAARVSAASSACSGRPPPVWKMVGRSSANCWMSAVLPTLRLPQTTPSPAPGDSHQASSCASSSVRLTKMAEAYRRWMSAIGAAEIYPADMDRGESCAELLAEHFAQGRHLVVGLDTDPERIPLSVLPDAERAERVVEFNRRIVAATAGLAAAYKPNAAFYEALGADGFRALAATITAIRAEAPGAAVILDAKRGDIGSTNSGYVTAAFDRLGADALTVHPYLGGEALAPFLGRGDRLVFVLARTSNPGAGEFQDLLADGVPLYRHVARAVARDWNAAGNCGLVVGATYPDELRAVRGDVPAGVAANREAGSDAYLIAASRSILYASGGENFADAARTAAEALNAEIRAAA